MRRFDVYRGPEAEVPKEPEGKLSKLTEQTCRGGRETVRLPQCHRILLALSFFVIATGKQLGPLKTWWDTRGKDFAVRNGHMAPHEANSTDTKLRKMYDWLGNALRTGDTMSGTEEEAELLTNALD